MKTMHSTTARLAAALPVAVLLLTAMPARAQVPGTIRRTNGQKLKGTIQWQPASRVYRVTSGGVSMQVSPRDVARVSVPKPRAMYSMTGSAPRQPRTLRRTSRS